MRKGSLPASIARSLPNGEIERQYAPDGLDESTIDALIEEAYAEPQVAPSRPAWLSTDADEQRRVRRRVRRAVRLLPVVLVSPDAPTGPSDGEAA
jgi:hypothetical protein